MQDTLKNILGAEVLELCLRLGEAATNSGSMLYLVGGPVRDVLLGVCSEDLDFMIEGDAPEFLKQLHTDWKRDFPDHPQAKKPIIFRRYRTGKLRFAEPICNRFDELDFSSSRSEQYPHAGGRPEIQAGTLAEDLRRRDFSINAMAIALSGDAVFHLFDYHEGRRHLDERLLSVLHENSFKDDPARLLRGLRFSARFGFDWEPETAALFEEGMSKQLLSLLPPARLFDEYRKALSDSAADAIISRLSKEGVLSQLDEGFDRTKLYLEFVSRSGEGQLESISPEIELWHQRLVLLADELDDKSFDEMLLRFEVKTAVRSVLWATRKGWKCKDAV